MKLSGRVKESHPDNRPDIQRAGEGKHQAGKQDGRRGKLKLPVFPIIHIRCGNLGEKQDGQDEVDYREYDVVDHTLDLRLGTVPGVLDSTGHVACTSAGFIGKRRKREQGTKHQANRQAEQKLLPERLIFHHTNPSIFIGPCVYVSSGTYSTGIPSICALSISFAIPSVMSPK